MTKARVKERADLAEGRAARTFLDNEVLRTSKLMARERQREAAQRRLKAKQCYNAWTKERRLRLRRDQIRTIDMKILSATSLREKAHWLKLRDKFYREGGLDG